MVRGKKKLTLFNPNTTAVVFDEHGRIVGGGERVEIDQLDKAGQEAVDNDLLVLETPERGDAEESASDEEPVTKAPGASAPKKAS